VKDSKRWKLTVFQGGNLLWKDVDCKVLHEIHMTPRIRWHGQDDYTRSARRLPEAAHGVQVAVI
jgi:hypothetical protein